MKRIPPLLLLCFLLPCLAVSANTKQQKQAKDAKEAREMAIEAKLLKGICSVDIIRNDLIEVVIDGGIVGSITDSEEAHIAKALGTIDQLQKPEVFTIRSDSHNAFNKGSQPIEVGRTTEEWHNIHDAKNRWTLFRHMIYRHRMYLKLAKALVPGNTYRIEIKRAKPDARFDHHIDFVYDDNTITPVIKINQMGYSSVAKQRYAYIGWWAGSMGAVPYNELKTFSVISETNQKTVLKGEVKLRAKADKNSGEDIYEMDISTLKAGRYHIVTPGLARSESFQVGGAGVFESYYHTTRAFYHQRCGIEFAEPYTSLKKAACHTEIWESGEFVANEGSYHHSPGHRDAHSHYKPKPNEKKMPMRGGYHDAADFDTFTYHLPATAQSLAAYEMNPEAFTDNQLNIPESGNDIPDILDEAHWGLMWYMEHQYESGAIPLGRVNQCDSREQNFEGGKKHAPLPPFGIIPPRKDSTPVFAAAAAQLSRNIRPFDPALADRYLQAAEKAWNFAKETGYLKEWEQHRSDEVPLIHPDYHGGKKKIVPGNRSPHWNRNMFWASAELLLTTKNKKYNEYIMGLQRREFNFWVGNGYRFWAYLTSPKELVDPELRAYLLNVFIKDRHFGADVYLKRTHEAGYRMGNGQTNQCGWGKCQGVDHGDILLRAYHITGEQKYLDAASLNADWHMGANPLSQTYISGMGVRHPDRPELSWFLYQNTDNNDVVGPTVMGISLYGNGPPLKSYPYVKGQKGNAWPIWRSWRDVWGHWAEIYSEFTIEQTVGPAAIMYAALYGLEHRAKTVEADQKPMYPLGTKNP